MAVVSKKGALAHELQHVHSELICTEMGFGLRSGGRRVVAASASRSRPMERASLRATFRLRCAERITPSELSKVWAVGMSCQSPPYDHENRQDCPVKLVVFDFDETLTLATFMTGNCEYADDEAPKFFLEHVPLQVARHVPRWRFLCPMLCCSGHLNGRTRYVRGHIGV